MIKRRFVIGVVVGSLVIQTSFFSVFVELKTDYLPFLGVPITYSTRTMYSFLIGWYFPIAIFVFSSMGFIRKYLSNYGYICIIRGMSRVKFFLKRWFLMVNAVMTFILMQMGLAFFIFNQKERFLRLDEIPYLINYLLLLVLIFSIQLGMELFVSETNAALFTNLFVVGSIVFAHSYYSLYGAGKLLYLMVPIYGMGFQTGLEIDNWQTNYIDIVQATSCLMLLLVGILCICFRRIRQIDIY